MNLQKTVNMQFVDSEMKMCVPKQRLTKQFIYINVNLVFLSDSDTGGAVYISILKPFTTSNAIIDCEFLNCHAKYSGAIQISSQKTVTTFVRGCTFQSNYVTEQGAATFYSHNVTLENCTFINNEARTINYSIEDKSGALTITSSNFNITKCSFKSNCIRGTNSRESYLHGGAMHSTGFNESFTECIFVGNYIKMTASWGVFSYGGAISSTYSDKRTFYNCTFSDNYQYLVITSSGSFKPDGGDVSILSDPCDFVLCTFSNTKMQSTIGTSFSNHVYFHGGIFSLSDLNIENCAFENIYEYGNNYENTGGAINCQGCLVVKSSTFRNNTLFGSESSFGAAIQYKSNTTIIDSKFINNTTKYKGGVIYISKKMFSIDSCEFYNNRASYELNSFQQSYESF